MQLRILTLNVRGLADRDKRQTLFHLLRTWSADIYCLQEVHAPPDASTLWSMEWGGVAHWNKHTAILFPRPLGCTTFDVLYDGRVLSSTFQHRGRTYTIANLYLPAQKTERLRFLDDLTQHHSLSFSSYDFLVGDWNMYPDSSRDRTAIPDSYTRAASFSTWPHFTTFIASFYDAALLGHPSSSFFTFYRGLRDRPSMQSRIDHVFAHYRHSTLTLSTQVTPYANSDHSAVLVSFSDDSSSSFLLHPLIPATFPRTLFTLLLFPYSALIVLLLTGMPQRFWLVLMHRIMHT